MEIFLMQHEVMEAMQDYILKKYGCIAKEDEMMGMAPCVSQPVWNKDRSRIIKHKQIPFCEMSSVGWFVAEVTQ